VAVLAACAGSAPPPAAPAHHGTAAAHHGACAANRNIVAVSTPSPDEPALVMYERSSWLSGFDVPTLVLWADGTVAMGDAAGTNSHHLLAATLPADQALSIVQNTLADLRTAPAYTEITDVTDQPSVQIVVRDANAWRSVEVYGLQRSTSDAQVPPAAQAIAAVYRRLLSVHPAASGPLAQSAERPKGWPTDLPVYRGQIVVDHVVRCSIRAQELSHSRS
jgi:hypothetical protein